MSAVLRSEEVPAMPPDDSFAAMMARLTTGDDTAAAEVFHRFEHRLIALARLHLDARLRQKIDPEDVVQSVYKSFFLRQAEGNLLLHNWHDLWAVLALITARKCGRWAQHFRARQRDLDHEVADAAIDWEVFSSEPSPQEAAQLSELVVGLLRDLGQRDGEILTLALQGYSADEISEQLDRPRRTVYRVLERIKARLLRLDQDEFAS
jgi:RNA polymerase sigma-70 factor (ECF subfamily)